jgi:hypothetical protein
MARKRVRGGKGKSGKGTIGEAGAVELSEDQLDQAQGGLLPATETSLKISTDSTSLLGDGSVRISDSSLTQKVYKISI